MLNKIIDSIGETLSISTDRLDATTRMDELSCDVIDTVSIIMNLEELFEIDIDDSEIEDISTIFDIVNLVEDKIQQNE